MSEKPKPKPKRPSLPAKRPQGGGQPTLCVPANYNAFLDLLRIGLFIEQACHRARLARATIYNWLDRGAKGEEPYATFLAEYNEASATAELTALSEIRTGKNNWQSRAWFLERRFRDRWGRNDKLEIKPIAPERVTAAEARRVMTELFPGDVTPNEDVRPVFSGPKTDDNEEP